MAAFFRFQRVRIVREEIYPEMNGKECTLLRMSEVYYRGESRPGWVVDLPHPKHGLAYGVLEFEIEPLTYLPTAEDLSEIENAPDFRVLAPTHMPSDALRAAVLK